MRTIYVYNDGSLIMADLINWVRAQCPTFPQKVQDERVHQFLVLHALIGEEVNPGYGFYETCRDTFDDPMPADAPVGAMHVRIDYDPHSILEGNRPGETETSEWRIEEIFTFAVDAIMEPYNPLQFRAEPIHAIRIKSKVAEDRTVEHTLWAPLLLDQEKVDEIVVAATPQR